MENQRNEISRFAKTKGVTIEKWVTETISGNKIQNQRKLGALLDKMSAGDVLIITELSRLSRSLHGIMAVMSVCLNKKIIIYSTKDGYAFDDSMNSKVLAFAFGLVAEIERNLISQRTREALAMRKAKGMKLGREKGYAPKIAALESQKTGIKEKILSGTSIKEICSIYEVSAETMRKFRRLNPDINNLIDTVKRNGPATRKERIYHNHL